jgi:hypothetical protein
MTNPQALHDLWLVLTAIAFVLLCATAIFLWKSFDRWWVRAIAIIFIGICYELVSVEIKNYSYPSPPPDLMVTWIWISGRMVEILCAGGGLGYLIFGRNGKGHTVP